GDAHGSVCVFTARRSERRTREGGGAVAGYGLRMFGVEGVEDEVGPSARPGQPRVIRVVDRASFLDHDVVDVATARWQTRSVRNDEFVVLRGDIGVFDLGQVVPARPDRVHERRPGVQFGARVADREVFRLYPELPGGVQNDVRAGHGGAVPRGSQRDVFVDLV